MSTTELEVQKASLARTILTTTDETMIDNIWLFLKSWNPVVPQKNIPKKREIGILDGKAKVIIHDDWSMTPEELDMV